MPQIWKIAIEIGAPETGARVRVNGVLRNTGVKQGSALSPILFNIFLGQFSTLRDGRIATSFGLQVSTEKSSIEEPRIIINECDLEVVECFKYLGSIEAISGDIIEEITKRR